MLVGSAPAGPGQFVYGLEAVHTNGPWENPDNYRKYNGVLRYTLPVGEGSFGVTAMAYSGRWNSTDQIPRRAVDSGLIGRFGAIDPSDGGRSYRYSLSADYASALAGGQLTSTAYAIRYYLSLYSNFTYFLDDPVNGDQFNQLDDRTIYGWNGSWRRPDTYFGLPMINTLGWDFRQDRLNPVALYSTRERERISTTREDNVREGSIALYFENQTRWNEWLRTIAGFRGDRYSFKVNSDNPDNSGNKNAGIGSPKLSVVLGPWSDTEYFINYGQAQAQVGDPARGQQLYASRCIGCHSIDANRVGPAHKGVVGRKAGSVPDYNYSPAVKKSVIVWTPATLDRWLTNPEQTIPGQKMGYSVPDAQDRADLIAWLAKNSG